MKKWSGASLVEHPGHPDQSVHGRKGIRKTASATLTRHGSGESMAVFSGGKRRGDRYYSPKKSSADRLERAMRSAAGKGKPYFRSHFSKSGRGKSAVTTRSIALKRVG